MIEVLLPAASWTVLTLVAVVLAWELLRDGRSAEGPRALQDRWGVLGRAVPVVLFTAFALLLAEWLVVPAALWWVNVAVLVTALTVGAARWHTLPWSSPDDGARGRRLGALSASALTVAAVLFLTL